MLSLRRLKICRTEWDLHIEIVVPSRRESANAPFVGLWEEAAYSKRKGSLLTFLQVPKDDCQVR